MFTEFEIKTAINKIYNGGPGSGNPAPGQGRGKGKPTGGGGSSKPRSEAAKLSDWERSKEGKKHEELLRKNPKSLSREERKEARELDRKWKSLVRKDLAETYRKHADEGNFPKEFYDLVDALEDNDHEKVKELSTQILTSGSPSMGSIASGKDGFKYTRKKFGEEVRKLTKEVKQTDKMYNPDKDSI
ncbi:MAG: hypothetical protein IJ122_05955 [Methanobrevibacter sp.]|nr:hypothetical protein [Methanobrevibacter sp.]